MGGPSRDEQQPGTASKPKQPDGTKPPKPKAAAKMTAGDQTTFVDLLLQQTAEVARGAIAAKQPADVLRATSEALAHARQALIAHGMPTKPDAKKLFRTLDGAFMTLYDLYFRLHDSKDATLEPKAAAVQGVMRELNDRFEPLGWKVPKTEVAGQARMKAADGADLRTLSDGEKGSLGKFHLRHARQYVLAHWKDVTAGKVDAIAQVVESSVGDAMTLLIDPNLAKETPAAAAELEATESVLERLFMQLETSKAASIPLFHKTARSLDLLRAIAGGAPKWTARLGGVQGKDAATPQADGGFALDAKSLEMYRSSYTRAVNAWGWIASKQVAAIHSIYTEAKKPKEPDLAQELLVSLALAALGGTVNVVGTMIARSIEKKAAAHLGKLVFEPNIAGKGYWTRTLRSGQPQIVMEDDITAFKEATALTARYLGEFGKDAFKDAIKSIGGPKIRGLVAMGKLPIDAFFEGKISTALDSGKVAQDKLESERVPTLTKGGDPLTAADAAAESLDEHYASTEQMQMESTVKSWLLYQAQSELGTYDTFNKTVPNSKDPMKATFLGQMPGETRGVPDQMNGVLAIHIYPGERWSHEYGRAQLPGLSRAMLNLIQDKPIKQLGLPVIFQITVNKYGKGMRSPAGPHTLPENQFTVRRDESGRLYNFARYPWHKEALARWVGAEDPEDPAEQQRGLEAFEYQTWTTTLRDLKVEPDKE